MQMDRLVPYPVGADAVCARCQVFWEDDRLRVELDIDADRWLLPDPDVEAAVRRAVAWHLFLLQRGTPFSTVDLDAPCDHVEILVDGTGNVDRFHISRKGEGLSLRAFTRAAARVVAAGR